MPRTSQVLAAALLAVACGLPVAAAPSREARELAHWVVKSRDHDARAFAVVDKKHARIFVYDAAGRLQGESPVLIGQAPGDDIAPDVGKHADQGFVPFKERTTPAGRFVSQPGVNRNGEGVVWVDWDSGFAIHRLRPGKSQRARLARIASDDLSARRASAGCVVVPVAFYESVVTRWLARGRAVVYVLPESGSVGNLFNML